MKHYRPITRLSAVFFALVALLGIGLVGAGAGAAEIRAVIRPGDTIAINVFAHPELSSQAVVDGQGNISLQGAGTISAGGVGTDMVAQRVALRLDKIVFTPVVDVRVVDRGKSVFISGGMGTVVPGGAGGTLHYDPGMTLTSLAAQLRLGPEIDVHMISIERNGKQMGPYDLFELQNDPQIVPPILAGDVVTLPNKAIGVDVEGAVATPGKTFVNPGQSLADAIGQVGGPTAKSNSSALQVTRDSVTTVASLGSALLTAPARDGDVVRVPPAVRVVVTGQVEKSGEVNLGSDQRLVEALYLAGGPNRWAELRTVQVIHDGETRTIDVTKVPFGDATAPNPVLHDGDVVFVPEGHKVDFSGFFTKILLGAGVVRNATTPL